MGIILAPISLLLLVLVFLLEMTFSIFYRTKDRKWFQLVSARMYRKAKLIDIFSNYLFPEFWNWIFSKNNSGYKFGRLGETMSSVLGKKKLDNSLSIISYGIYYILFAIDIPSWKYGGHCVRWIMTDAQIENFNKIN